MDAIISAIICTHNPRQDYIDEVLIALKHQTLPLQKWELLLIDNASDISLNGRIDLSWHPNARYILEEKIGLSWARIRGIEEAMADVLLFIDDDNVLANNYLDATVSLSNEWPQLGAWGGQVHGRFEVEPDEWSRPFLHLLAIREFDRDLWHNLPFKYDPPHPAGAGLCIRSVVARQYSAAVRSDSRRGLLGRSGASLCSHEDADLVFTTIDQGYGTGLFVRLNLTHLIPRSRLQEAYLLKLVEDMSCSVVLFKQLRGLQIKKLSAPWRVAKRIGSLMLSSQERRFTLARERGLRRGLRQINGR